MSHITVDIVSLEKRLYKGEVKAITAPTTSGEITVLPNHEALVTSLQAGELRLRVDEGQGIYAPDMIFVAISGGFMEVSYRPVNTSESAVRTDADVPSRGTPRDPHRSATIVNIIADSALRVDEIDEATAEEARKKAEEAMESHRRGKTRLDNEEYARVAASLAHAAVQIQVARRKRR